MMYSPVLCILGWAIAPRLPTGSTTLEQHIIKEQAGFRPGKSCSSQLLNLTQHIEDGYQESMITGTDFVDLSSAYDTVNHRCVPTTPAACGGTGSSVKRSENWSHSIPSIGNGRQTTTGEMYVLEWHKPNRWNKRLIPCLVTSQQEVA